MPKQVKDNNDTMADNDENDETEQAESNFSINLEDLSDDQIEALTENPDVKRMLTYEDTSIPDISDGLEMLQNPEDYDIDEPDAYTEAYNLLVSGIAERSGRITEATTRKVLDGLVEEYTSTQ